MVGDQITEERHVEHYSQECKDSENHEVFHALCQSLGRVLVPGTAEHERLVSVPEGLGEQGQQHGNLAAGTVYPKLDLAVLLVGHDMLECNLVEDLVEDAHKTQQQDGPCVREHTAGKFAVESVGYSPEFLHEAEGYHEGAEQVHEEYQTHTVVIPYIQAL